MMWPSWWIGGCVRVDRDTPKAERGVATVHVAAPHSCYVRAGPLSAASFHIPEARRGDVVASVAVAAAREA